MTAYLALAVTDTDPAPLLLDGSTGVDATWGPGGPDLTPAGEQATLSLFLRITGSNPETVWNSLARKLFTDAPRGSMADGLAQSNLVLIHKLAKDTANSYIDVIGVQSAQRNIYRANFSDWVVKLVTQPYARGAAVTLSGLTVPSGGGGIWLGEIAGTYPAYTRITATDTSANSKRVVSFQLAQRAGSLLASTDQIAIMTPTPQSPGASQAEATARGGTASKLTLSAAMQAVCRAAGPTTGRHNGRMRAWGRLRSSAAVIGQPANAVAVASAAAGSIGTASITSVIVPYNGSAPYVSGVNQLGAPSAYIQSDLRLLVAGGTQQVALNPLFYDDFELNSLVRWFPGSATYVNVNTSLASTGSGGSASVTTGGTFKDTGTYGAQLTAVSPNDGASIHHSSIAILSQAAGTQTRQSSHCRIKIQAETNNTDSGLVTALRGFAHWVKYISGSNVWMVGLATLDGTNWALYMAISTSVDGVALVGDFVRKSATFTLGAGFHDSEITCDVTAAGFARLTIDGVPQGGFSLTGTTIEAFGSTAVATSPANTTQATETFHIDTFPIMDGYLGTGASVSGYALIYSWDAAPNAGGYLLKYLEGTGGVWNSIDAGLVTTYTLTTLLPNGVTINSPPPSTMPALVPAQAQLFAGLAGSSLRQPWSAVQTLKNSNAWEWRDLGAGSVPPVPVRQGQSAPPWDWELRASGTVGATIECDAIAYADDRLDKAQVEQLALAAPAAYVFDTGSNGVGAELLGGTSVTVSGGLITDATRVADTSGDSLPVPSGYGVWPASTNLVAGGFWDTGVLVDFEATDGGFFNTASQGSGWIRCFRRGAGQTVDTTDIFSALTTAVTAGNTYTISFLYRSDGLVTFQFVAVTTPSSTVATLNMTTIRLADNLNLAYVTYIIPAAKTALRTFHIQPIWWDSTVSYLDMRWLQIEAGSVPTPFAGYAATRTAGRVQVATSGASVPFLSSSVFGVVARLRVGVATAATTNFWTAFGWYADGSNYYWLYYDPTSRKWNMISTAAGVSAIASSPTVTYFGGEHVTVAGKRDVSGNLGVSVNGSDWWTVAAPGIPTGLPASVDFGTLTAATGPLMGNVIWETLWTTPPTATELITLNDTGDIAPRLSPS